MKFKMNTLCTMYRVVYNYSIPKLYGGILNEFRQDIRSGRGADK